MSQQTIDLEISYLGAIAVKNRLVLWPSRPETEKDFDIDNNCIMFRRLSIETEEREQALVVLFVAFATPSLI